MKKVFALLLLPTLSFAKDPVIGNYELKCPAVNPNTGETFYLTQPLRIEAMDGKNQYSGRLEEGVGPDLKFLRQGNLICSSEPLTSIPWPAYDEIGYSSQSRYCVRANLPRNRRVAEAGIVLTQTFTLGRIGSDRASEVRIEQGSYGCGVLRKRL